MPNDPPIIDMSQYYTPDSPRNYETGDTVQNCTVCHKNYLGYEHSVMCKVCLSKPRGMFFELDSNDTK